MKTASCAVLLVFFLSLNPNAGIISLKDCIGKSLTSSTAVSQAAQEARKAVNDAGINGAPFYPSLELSFNDTLAGYDVNGNPVNLFTFYPDNYTAALQANYNLFNMGKDSARRSYYMKKQEEAELKLTSAKQDAAWNCIKTFYEVLKAQKSLMVSEILLKQRQENLKLTESLYQAGIKSKSYFLDAQIQLANSNIAVISGKNSLLSSKAALNELLGLAPGAETIPEDDLKFAKYEKSLDQSLSSAFNGRPDWLILAKQREESSVSLGLAEINLLPSVSLDASYGLYLDKYARDSSLWTHKGALDQNSGWGLTLSLNYPLFDGGVNSLKADNAKLDLQVIDIQTASLKRFINKEVYLEWYDLERIFKSVPVYEQQVLLSKESMEITRSKYREGTASFLELVGAEVNYSSSQINWYQSIYDYKSQTADLMRSMGAKLYKEE